MHPDDFHNGNGHDDDDDHSVDPGADANDFQAPPENGHANGNGHGNGLIHIAETPEDFLPERQASLTHQMAVLLRKPEVWAEISPLLKAVSGTGPTIYGSRKYDEAGCMFDIKRILNANGASSLAALNPAQISGVFKRANRINTGQTWGALIAQGKQLALEDKRRRDLDAAE
jgi:hypothetical protein